MAVLTISVQDHCYTVTLKENLSNSARTRLMVSIRSELLSNPSSLWGLSRNDRKAELWSGYQTKIHSSFKWRFRWDIRGQRALSVNFFWAWRWSEFGVFLTFPLAFQMVLDVKPGKRGFFQYRRALVLNTKMNRIIKNDRMIAVFEHFLSRDAAIKWHASYLATHHSSSHILLE